MRSFLRRLAAAAGIAGLIALAVVAGLLVLSNRKWDVAVRLVLGQLALLAGFSGVVLFLAQYTPSRARLRRFVAEAIESADLVPAFLQKKADLEKRMVELIGAAHGHSALTEPIMKAVSAEITNRLLSPLRERLDVVFSLERRQEGFAVLRREVTYTTFGRAGNRIFPSAALKMTVRMPDSIGDVPGFADELVSFLELAIDDVVLHAPEDYTVTESGGNRRKSIDVSCERKFGGASPDSEMVAAKVRLTTESLNARDDYSVFRIAAITAGLKVAASYDSSQFEVHLYAMGPDTTSQEMFSSSGRPQGRNLLGLDFPHTVFLPGHAVLLVWRARH